jgi:hypothetical protein
MTTEDIDPELERQKCQQLFCNLLTNRHPDVLSTVYIRKFFKTERCDRVFDMRPHREEYEHRICKDDPERLKRILSFESGKLDEEVAAQAVIHYGHWHKSKLVESLSVRNWLWFQTVHRVERVLAALFATNTGYGGIEAAKASFKHLSEDDRQ